MLKTRYKLQIIEKGVKETMDDQTRNQQDQDTNQSPGYADDTSDLEE